jgi:hypothetical protein
MQSKKTWTRESPARLILRVLVVPGLAAAGARVEVSPIALADYHLTSADPLWAMFNK